MQRRALLGALAGASATVAADCSAQAVWPAGAGASGDGDPAPDGPRGPTRGESDADVSVAVTEDDPDVEYRPDRHAVRYVAGHGGGEPGDRAPMYETTPFADWAEMECLHAAARAAAEHVGERLGTSPSGHGVGSIDGREDSVAILSTSTGLDRDGDVINTQSVDFEELVAATPATVDATYRIADQVHRTTAPVYAEYAVVRQA